MFLEVLGHCFCPVSRQAIPDHDDIVPKVPTDVSQESDDPWCRRIHVQSQGKVKSYPMPFRGYGQSGNGSHFLFRSGALVKKGCLPSWSPTAPNKRTHQESAFIDKHQGCSHFRSVFFILRQSFLIQPWITSSFRSLARRSGFCGDQFIDLSNLPI